AQALRATNGAITVGAHCHIGGAITATNGAVRLGEGSVIDGKASTGNGSISLYDAHVAGGLATRSGAVTIGPGSRVEGGVKTVDSSVTVGAGAHVKGGLVVEASSNASCVSNCTSNGSSSLFTWLFGSGAGSERPPRIVIGPGAVVEGALDFRRSVDLYVSDRAKIGPVKGATAKTFSGDEP
ncbi:MAG TPA: hypothetical protein VND97_04475, partial [Beijerinckiaceae bacterium]|nr:hypothetical protein [Beijerinckiaceae bacterium]